MLKAMDVSTIAALFTPAAILTAAILALSVYTVESRERRRGAMADRQRERERDEREFIRQEQEWAAQAEERALRTAAIVPETSPDGQFILIMSTEDPVLMLRVISAAQRLYTEHGFEVPEIESVTSGSVKVKFRTRIASFFRNPRTIEIGQELQAAAEEATLGRTLSENNERNANAAATLINAMAGLHEAQFISSGLVVTKQTDENGRASVITRVPTPLERAQLNDRPETLGLIPVDRGELEATPIREISPVQEDGPAA